MGDEKDRLGTKLRDKQKAEEDRYFKQRDEELIRKRREADVVALEAEARRAAIGRCPRCGITLLAEKHNDVAVDVCPERHGMWLDEGECEQVAKRESDSWLGRFFYRPKLTLG